jgi:transcriptional antiterminator RfaH
MAYWAAARFQPKYEKLALHFLRLSGYAVYLPRLRGQRIVRGRKVEITPPLFPGYVFVTIELQWHAAHRAPGTNGLVLNGGGPAHVPDSVIDELRARERNGLIELPRVRGLRAGDRVRIASGPFAGQFGLYAGMRPRQRVEVLLSLLGAQQRVTLPKDDVEEVASRV